jgi:hypothetical protein
MPGPRVDERSITEEEHPPIAARSHVRTAAMSVLCQGLTTAHGRLEAAAGQSCGEKRHESKPPGPCGRNEEGQ